MRRRYRRRFCFYDFILALGFILIAGIFMLKNLQGMEILSFMKQEERETRIFVKQLGAGLNLGNTLDVHNLHFETKEPYDFETYWGNPVTSREMLEDIKSAGFDVLRIPVTWYEHVDENDIIDQVWLDRVRQVADYGLEAGMHVIINAHHDSWYTPDDEHLPGARERMRTLWSQIAVHFKEYDQMLLFESMNEPRLIGEAEEWSGGTSRSREIINELNEIFVRTVRESGGKNDDRYLIIPTYCAKPQEEALEDFRLPEGERIIASVHLYSPYDFTLNMQGTDEFNHEDPVDTGEIDEIFENLNEYFVIKGIPVIITEFSAIDKKNEQQRTAWARYVKEKADALGIACVWWDAGPGEEEGKPFPLYNRYTRKWLFPDLLEVLTE